MVPQLGRNTVGRSRRKKYETTAAVSRQNQQFEEEEESDNLSHLISLVASATIAAHSFLSQNDLVLLPSQTLTLESKISTTSDSLSRLLALVEPISLSPLPLRPLPSSPCWFNRFLASQSDDDDIGWVEAFRMSRPSFYLLIRLIAPALTTIYHFHPEFTLGAALFRLSHGATYKSVGRRFMMDSTTACRCFYTVCKAIVERMGHMFDFRSESDLKRITSGFGWESLPNCCGALGFESFSIDCDLLGKNGSLMVQALVDLEGRFLDVSAGWSSAMKPETILRQSRLFSSVNELLIGPYYDIGDDNSIPQYILGDSCFPLLPWLITPYTVVENEKEEAFNSVHNNVMELVKKAFGKIRTRWELLSHSWKEQSVEAFPFVIVACCLLHNYLIKCSDDEMQEESLTYFKDSIKLPPFEGGEEDEIGKRTRDLLASSLKLVSCIQE
ncbi:protein ALP1-like [Impatiens glandulifera]|uniref:protein ALP1-like n=1 Tax=Impatiens glandulifera TaxID=253017 RepID=UPI001FB0CD3C|nr:protein ALP1-like [Impatiens glandulifera]